ncbi:MAG: hypothetical protein EOP04_17575, partial [Proteobacteria bacterium]
MKRFNLLAAVICASALLSCSKGKKGSDNRFGGEVVAYAEFNKTDAQSITVGKGALQGTRIAVPAGAVPKGTKMYVVSPKQNPIVEGYIEVSPAIDIRLEDRTGRRILASTPLEVTVPRSKDKVISIVEGKFKAILDQRLALGESVDLPVSLDIELSTIFESPVVDCGENPTLHLTTSDLELDATPMQRAEAMQDQLLNSQISLPSGALNTVPGENVTLSSTKTYHIDDAEKFMESLRGPTGLNLAVNSCGNTIVFYHTNLNPGHAVREVSKDPVRQSLIESCADFRKYDSIASFKNSCDAGKVDPGPRDCRRYAGTPTFEYKCQPCTKTQPSKTAPPELRIEVCAYTPECSFVPISNPTGIRKCLIDWKTAISRSLYLQDKDFACGYRTSSPEMEDWCQDTRYTLRSSAQSDLDKVRDISSLSDVDKFYSEPSPVPAPVCINSIRQIREEQAVDHIYRKVKISSAVKSGSSVTLSWTGESPYYVYRVSAGPIGEPGVLISDNAVSPLKIDNLLSGTQSITVSASMPDAIFQDSDRIVVNMDALA